MGFLSGFSKVGFVENYGRKGPNSILKNEKENLVQFEPTLFMLQGE